MMLPESLTKGMEEAAESSASTYWNTPHGRLVVDRNVITFHFTGQPEHKTTVGEVQHAPGQRPTWHYHKNAHRAIEQLAEKVGVSFEALRDTDPDPFKEQKPMTENGNGTTGRKPTPVSTTEPTPATTEAAITTYADRGAIRELVARFKAGLSLKNADEHEYLALAHLCAKYEIDPFNGEAWIIPNKGVMVGIKGLRKMANRQAKDLDCRWWTEFLEVRNVDEALKYGIPETAKLAKVCVLRRSDHIEAWTAALKIIREAAPDLPYEFIKDAIGAPPVFIGIGYVEKGESSKMPLGQLAMKRAEAHAIKQAFDVDQSTEGDDSYQATEIQIERVEEPAPQIEEPKVDETPDTEPDIEEAEVVEETPDDEVLIDEHLSATPNSTQKVKMKYRLGGKGKPVEAPETAAETEDEAETDEDSSETPDAPQSAPEPEKKDDHKPMVAHAQQALIEQLKTESPATFIQAAELLNKVLGTEYDPQHFYLSIVQDIRTRRPELPKTEVVEIKAVWEDVIALAVAA